MVDVSRKIEASQGLLRVLDDDGRAVGLAHQAIDLRVAFFSVDDELRGGAFDLVVAAVDAPLELEDDGAGGVDDPDAVLAGQAVGGGRLAMRAKEDGAPLEPREVGVLDGV